jgi:hypothetical protein
MFGHTRPTKHVINSQLSLVEVSLYEMRKTICSGTGYQTHPKAFFWVKSILSKTGIYMQ